MSLTSSWEFLKTTKLPIFIYGMGDGALKILNIFKEKGIPCSGIFASDEFVRGHNFEGHLVHKLTEVEEKINDFIIVLAFAAGYRSLIEKVISLSQKHILIAPDVPVYGDGLFTKEYVKEYFNEFLEVYESLYDEKSKQVFSAIIEGKITGRIEPLINAETSPNEAFDNIIKLNNEEIYVDLGAYNGDTIIEFLEKTKGEYHKVYAVEPNLRNYKKLCIAVEGMQNIEVHNSAVWSEDTTLTFSKKSGRQGQIVQNGIETVACSVDSILNGEIATYIKYDVEGSELQALIGSKHTLIESKPKILVALYHRNEDMFKLPLLIKSMNSDYKFYIRHYPYIPAWDTNLIAIP